MKKIRLKDIATHLDHLGLQYMATIGLDGRPKVRPMQFMVLEDDRLWFCTNSKKAIYAELMRDPHIELCGSRLEANEIDSSWIRLSAEVVFEENLHVKELIMKKSPIVHELYKDDIENPIFKVFYLKNIEGSMNNLGHVRGLKEREDFAKPMEFKFE